MAQAYGFLRTNLGFASLGTQDVKILLVTSSGPKEGKTTTAANLAIGLAREGKNTFLIDLDLRKPALHRLFNLDKDQGFTNVLLSRITLEQALQPTLIPRQQADFFSWYARLTMAIGIGVIGILVIIVVICSPSAWRLVQHHP